MKRLALLAAALAHAIHATDLSATLDDAEVLGETFGQVHLALACVGCPITAGDARNKEDGQDGLLFVNISTAASGREILLNDVPVYPLLGRLLGHKDLRPQIPTAGLIPASLLSPGTTHEDWVNANLTGLDVPSISYDHAILPAREEGDAVITFDILAWGSAHLNSVDQRIVEITVENKDSGPSILGVHTPKRTKETRFEQGDNRPAWCPPWIPSVIKKLQFFFWSAKSPPDPPGHTVVWEDEWDEYGRKGTFHRLFNRARDIIGFAWPVVVVAVGFMFIGFLFLRERLSAWWRWRFRHHIETVKQAKARRARWRREEAERRFMMQDADLDEEEEGLLDDMDDDLGTAPLVTVEYQDKVLPPLPSPSRIEDKQLPPTPESKPLPPLPPPSPDIL